MSGEVCVAGLPLGFSANGIANAVAEFTGAPVLVLSAYPNRVELRLPNNCATHVVKMLIEMHLNAENPVARQRVSVTRT